MDFLKKELVDMGKRIMNNSLKTEVDKNGKEKYSDETAITKLVNNAFTKECAIKSPEAVFKLNSLIVATVKEIDDPKYTDFIKALSDYKKVGYNDTVYYNVNGQNRTTARLTATGSSVDFTPIPKGKKKIPATPFKFQFGVKYSIADMIENPVNGFRDAVNLVRKKKTEDTVMQIWKITRDAVSASKIPSRQIINTANITIADFRKVEASLIRYGNNKRPFLLADSLFINTLAERQAIVPVAGMADKPLFLTEELQEQLLRDIEVTMVSKSIAIPYNNPWQDDMHTTVKLPYDEAIMVAGGQDSPYKIRDYGDITYLQDSKPDTETEEFNMKISYKMDVTLLLTQGIAYLKDTSIIL